MYLFSFMLYIQIKFKLVSSDEVVRHLDRFSVIRF
jgi:hypothetical protein